MANSPHRLIWRADRQVYELDDQGRMQLLSLASEEEWWAAWLETHTSFSFQGHHGHLTVRKEARPRGDQYWYAYRRVGPKMAKKYLGRSRDLTLTRLEELAAAFSLEATPAAVPSRSLPEDGQGWPPLGVAGENRTAPQEAAPLVLVAPSRPPRELLLATKLHPPRLRSHLIARPLLLHRLQQGLAAPLTLLSAPAGFGKTTLLAQWLAETRMPVAWLSLDAEDNDPVRFLTYVFAALQTRLPHLSATSFSLLEAAQSTPLESAFTLLANDLASRQTPDFALVLDDYHVITAPALHHAITFLVEHTPPQLHLVLASRTDPPLPLARLRARGHLAELRADLLRLSVSETHTFLHEVSGLDLPPDAIAVLERRTEGWVAGLQLAALSLEGRADIPAFLAAFTGSHRFVLDYLSEEVLSRQPAPVQSFLLRTAILERLCGSLCEAVTGQADGQAILETLEQTNLFVVPLDDERHWYRYHHLFAEVLKSRLEQAEPDLVPILHRRASTWHEHQGLLIEAVHHALAAEEVEWAVQLMEQAYPVLMAQGSPQLLLAWLKAVPDSLVQAHPLLCVYHAGALHVLHQVAETKARLGDAQRALTAGTPPDVVRVVLGFSAWIRGNLALYSGDLAQALPLAQQALDLLPETAATMLPRAYATMGVMYPRLLNGEVTPAIEQQVRALVALTRVSRQLAYFQSRIILLARLYRLQGRLRAAADLYEEAGEATLEEFFQVLSYRAVYCFGLGELWREWNRLDEAEALLVQGLDQVRDAVSTFAEEVWFGHLTLARLQQARGHHDRARATLEEFRQVADRRAFAPQLKATAAAVRAQLDLADGHLAAARRWAEECGLSAHDAVLPYPREREYLTLARLRIAEGREEPTGPFLQEADHLLKRLLEEAEANARQSSVLEIRILQALTLHAKHDLPGALTTLERALALAAPEGYLRLFLDEGMPMQDVLRAAQTRGIMPAYVPTLLAASGEPASSPHTVPAALQGGLIEPLTAREREVLHLLAEGASNGEMASRLVVTVGTVKKHVANLCGKLGVQSRTQAIARAQALHLL